MLRQGLFFDCITLFKPLVMSSLAQFVLNQHLTYNSVLGGVYTVIPVTRNGILDVPFHADRLATSWEALYNDLSPVDAHKWLNSDIVNVKYGSLEATGKIAVCWGKSRNDNDQLSTAYQFFPSTWKTSTDAFSPCSVDFAQVSRSPMQAKYTRWLVDRPAAPIHPNDDTLIYYCNLNNQQIVTEGLTTNIGVFLDDQTLCTCSSPQSKSLNGNMMKFISLLAENLLNLKVIKVDEGFLLDSLFSAQGMFVSSAGRGLQPVSNIKSPTFGNKEFEYADSHVVRKLFAATQRFLHHDLGSACDGLGGHISWTKIPTQ